MALNKGYGHYPVEAPDGTLVYPIAPAGYESRWVCSKATYEQQLGKGLIEWKKVAKDGEEKWQVYQKHYIGEAKKQPSNLWNKEEGNKKATRDLNALFDDKKVFDHPKPIGLMRKIIQLATSPNDSDIILDFFAGSGTTGHAVMEQNHQDAGNRRYILVQLPEQLDEKNKAQKVAFDECKNLGIPENISELSKERLRRVAVQMNSELSLNDLDNGFRVFRLAASNINVWHPDKTDLEESLLSSQEHLIEGRTEEDILYELLLKRGVDLAVPLEIREISGKAVYSIGFGVLFACLDDAITKDQIEDIGQGIVDWCRELSPSSDTHVFFRDSAFRDDVSKANMAAILVQNGITHVRSL